MRACAIAIAVVALAAPAAASEPDLFGFGARAGALAGTGAADAEGYDAVYANPAGLVGPTRRRLTIGYVLARYDLTLDGPHRPVDGTNGILIGADLPLPFGGVLQDRLAIGLGFYFPVGVINRARDGFTDEPRLALLDDRTQVVSVLVAAAARLHQRVSVGIGVLALAALVGDITIKPDASGRITTVSEEQLLASYAPVAGVRVVATRWLSLGAVVRGESKSRYDIEVKNSLGTLLPIQLPTLHIAGTAQLDPLQAALGASFRVNWLRFNLELTWKHWSAYQNPVENATPGAPAQPPPGYHDTAVPRVGVEATGAWGRARLHGRVGYFYEQSPAPRNAPILIDADRHALTGGAGFEWLGAKLSLAVDAFAQWHHLASSERAHGDLGVFGFTVGVDL
jgi:long-chain fatty acid transport protein